MVQRVTPLSGYIENVLVLPLTMKQSSLVACGAGKVFRAFAWHVKPMV
jgi:hypothetical protein